MCSTPFDAASRDSPSAAGIPRALEWLAENEAALVAELAEWLRIPSISTRAEFAGATRKAAEWAAEHLRGSGLEVRILETAAGDGAETGQKKQGAGDGEMSGERQGAGANEQEAHEQGVNEQKSPGPPPHPVVVATSEGDADYVGPHVLFYGHYDVQPPDPEEEWHSPPFEPVILRAESRPAGPASPDSAAPGDRIVARGASDDKGQVMMFLAALRAWMEATGKPGGGARVTVLLEGEEEVGSLHLREFLEAHRAEFEGCDVVVISDTHQLSRTRPAITYGVRGLLYTEVTLRGPSTDLHSGLWGGKVPNPLNELTRILGDLWDEQRRVAIPGFYEDVREPTAEEREAWREFGAEAAGDLGSIGYPPEADVGEMGWSMLEREWARPTAEIHGIMGGYTQAGAKTVIPARASAKVSFRLVADQDPERIAREFFGWLESRRPPGCRWELKVHSAAAGATCATDSPELQAAARAIEKATGVAPALIKSGGTIPVAGWLKQMLGIETIFMGFGLDDDRLHAPNEKFELPCFRAGARSHACLIDELLRMKSGSGAR